MFLQIVVESFSVIEIICHLFHWFLKEFWPPLSMCIVGVRMTSFVCFVELNRRKRILGCWYPGREACVQKLPPKGCLLTQNILVPSRSTSFPLPHTPPAQLLLLANSIHV